MPLLTLTEADREGAPGATVGWGFSLSNYATNLDLYVTSVYADGSLGSGAIGTFSDAIASWSQASGGLVVNAEGLFSGSFPATALATYAIDAVKAQIGDAVSGAIYLTYDLCDAALNCPSGGTLRAQYGGQDAVARVSVAAAAPVPATAALLALGLAGLGRRRSGGHPDTRP